MTQTYFTCEGEQQQQLAKMAERLINLAFTIADDRLKGMNAAPGTSEKNAMAMAVQSLLQGAQRRGALEAHEVITSVGCGLGVACASDGDNQMRDARMLLLTLGINDGLVRMAQVYSVPEGVTKQ